MSTDGGATGGAPRPATAAPETGATAITVYGIRGCDTVKKARAWLEARGIPYRFHDFKKEGLGDALLDAWIADLGWEPLLNRRGTTWRRLPAERRDGVGAAEARALMRENTSIIKRPVVEYPGGRLVGFDPGRWTTEIGR